MKFKSILLAVALCFALLLASCSPDPDTPMGVNSPAAAQNTAYGRIQIVRVGVIKDDLTYGARRGLYIITDTQTGKEYIGVSGVGISETGAHNTGKTRSSDER